MSIILNMVNLRHLVTQHLSVLPFSQHKRRALYLVIFSLLGWYAFHPEDDSAKVRIEGGSTNQALVHLKKVMTQKGGYLFDPKTHTATCPYQVKKGDSLSAIFTKLGFTQKELLAILDADQYSLALDELQAKMRLLFTKDKKERLIRFAFVINPAKQMVFTRDKHNAFTLRTLVKNNTWHSKVYSGIIKNSFYQSASDAGLSPMEIYKIDMLFKTQISLARTVQKGDRFIVLSLEQYVDDQYTGVRDILGVRFTIQGKNYDAFLAKNGNYYNRQGRSLIEAFLKFPTHHHYRISSPFTMHRKNPITKRWTPHFGVDFAMPEGTAVLATGNGIISMVSYHPFAGKYIVIQNSGKYVTRFLHLSKILVRRGQHITRGEKIALSGNTGRSTGPHLHYEFHINGHPVNPVTAKIPLDKPLTLAQRRMFMQRVNSYLLAMNQSGLNQLAKREKIPKDQEDG